MQPDYGVSDWTIVTLAVAMFSCWTLTYVLIVVKSYREETYGLPIVNACLNISWECIFAFDMVGGLPPFHFALVVGHRVWLGVDLVLLFLIFRNGKRFQPDDVIKQRFPQFVLATLVLSFAGVYLFHGYFRDVYGVGSSWIINVLMSALFIGLYRRRSKDLLGLSYPAAWFKLLGNATGALLCYYWWPAQFGDDGLLIPPPGGNPVFDNVPEPPSYSFLNFLYIATLVLDLWYIWLLEQRRREIRRGNGGQG